MFAPAVPLLAKEPEIFPEELFSLPAELRWSVAHVRSRQEKLLARHLLQNEIPFYLPQSERITERAARRFRSYLPLFSGYVFFRGGDAARVAAQRSGVVVQILDVADQALLSSQLEQIRRLQLAGASLHVYEELVPDDPVTIAAGPFRGYSGVVLREGRRDRLIVSLTMLRKNVAVELERPMLRRARR